MTPKNLSKTYAPVLLERFLEYVRQWTTSDSELADQGISPSTQGQQDFAKKLVNELNRLGITDTQITGYGYVCARIPATPGMEHVPAIGFSAHLDTSEEVSGKNVAPSVITDYDGKPVHLADGLVLDPETDPELKNATGDTIITSDGTTLLGADDKAGIAIIMTAAEQLMCTDANRKPVYPHGPVEILFSPDEETGHGMDNVPLDWLTARFCYTLDGGNGGEIETECFNAWQSDIVITGKAKHTGSARPDMINAVTLAAEFISSLPRNEAPETTDGYQGFYAPMNVTGHIESASISLLLRDFDREQMQRRIATIDAIAETLRLKYPGAGIKTVHTKQYLNMKENIRQHPQVTELLVKAVEQSGITPCFKPIRGGTDGSRLTEMGIPCPNIFTGGHNFHSRTEWASLSQMLYGVETVLNIIRIHSDT